MKEVLVVPCIDVAEGRIVKGVHLKDIRDVGDPIEAARLYSQQGADEIWMLDMKASVEGRSTRLGIIREMAAVCTVPLCVGGGIRSLQDAEAVLAAGASRVGIGSAALENPELIRRVSYKAGKENTVALVDVHTHEDGRFEVLGRGQVGSGVDMVPWIRKLHELGAGAILLTTTQDGAQSGYDIAATRAAAEASPLPVIASGGAGKLEDFLEAVQEGKAQSVLAASVFHFGTLTVGQVKDYLSANGVKVRGEERDLSFLKFDEKGLIPAIAQDARTGAVLMQAYMNQESLHQTLLSGFATYYSRSRQALWRKGETSGNEQRVREISYDCDGDCLLLKVEQTGPVCHTGEYTCFHNALVSLEGGRGSSAGSGVLQDVYNIVLSRMKEPREGSYTNRLLEGGVDKIGKKVIEEAAEVVLAAKDGKAADVRFEAADLIYHLMVLLAQQGVTPDELYAELAGRK